jgi:DNA repair protein RecN (Recombination protein N)
MFESRINTFREAVLGEYNEILLDSGPNNNNLGRSSNLMSVLQSIRANTWASTDKSDDESLFANVLEFREEVKAVETKLASAQSAYEILSSMTAPDSAAVALEKVRKILYSISKENCGQLFDSIEKTHDLLNNVEESLNACARTIDGKSNSVIATLEKMVCTGISLEQIDNIVGDWNALARKHGISPYSLPKCHESLRQELDGNDEAAILLQEAEEDERIALKVYSDVCREISERRKEVAAGLSESVTKLLPSLGLEGTTFQVQMRLDDGGFENPRCSTDTIGVDTADFLLLHQKSVNGERDKLESTHGGYIDQVGSSGEKSRVLLAIETSLPGSIGTACNSHGAGSESVQNMETAPISIVYDEIDAHVGGRAAVTMARLLANQTRRQPASCDAIASRGSQIVAITHSASLAALADHHIVIERSTPRELESSTLVKAYSVDGPSRRKEIARMASGDMAMTEAEQFADALIRDALLQRDLA